MNFGLNLGEAGGAGIAAHLHMHALPRWIGDANFMTVTAGTRVLPEALDTTWEKLRAAWPRPARMSGQSRTLQTHRVNPVIGTSGWRGSIVARSQDGHERRFDALGAQVEDEYARFKSEPAVALDPRTVRGFGEGAAIHQLLRANQTRFHGPIAERRRLRGHYHAAK